MDDVLLVDDNASFRAVARALLEQGGFRVVGEAGTVAGALRRAAEVRPDVVLLDIGLPDRDGVSACADLQAVVPEAAIVFCSVRGADQYEDAVRRSPAVGFLPKSRLSAPALAAVLAQRDRR
ncbi:response regulator transcription factor [Lentzea sp. NPDC058450]|uniref:response regulator n=1 Tax=Lentzea sp. NPDC058450 TaxID=3346505 RepID=UPI00364B292B